MPSTLILVGSLWSRCVEFLLVELADRLVGVEEAAAPEDAAVPAVHAVAGDRQRPLVERFALVVERGEVEVGDRAPALAVGTHAAGAAEGHPLGLPVAFLDHPGRLDRGDVEGERLGRADLRLAEPAEEDAQHRVGIGDGADRRAGVGARSAPGRR